MLPVSNVNSTLKYAFTNRGEILSETPRPQPLRKREGRVANLRGQARNALPHGTDSAGNRVVGSAAAADCGP